LCYSIADMSWLEKYWKWIALAVLAITLVVGWGESHCQTQANQCRANYAAQARTEAAVSKPLSVSEQASEQEAIAAACEPNCYFCRLFSAANVPTMLLFLIGLGATFAALLTLAAIKRQAETMNDELEISKRARLLVAEPEITTDGRVKFPIENYGHIDGRITHILVELIVMKPSDGSEIYRRDFERDTDIVVVPGRNDGVAFFIHLPTQFLTETSLVAVEVSYDTGFNKADKAAFSRVYQGNVGKWQTAYEAETFDFNDD
jgi:hypothetical protein